MLPSEPHPNDEANAHFEESAEREKDPDRIPRSDVEKILNLSRSAIRKLVTAGDLCATRDERGWLWYSRQEVVALKYHREAQRENRTLDTDHQFGIDRLRYGQVNTQREQARQAAEEQRRSTERETQRHQRRLEEGLQRLAKELRESRSVADEIVTLLQYQLVASIAQTAAGTLPENVKATLWAGLRGLHGTEPQKASSVAPEPAAEEALKRMRKVANTRNKGE